MLFILPVYYSTHFSDCKDKKHCNPKTTMFCYYAEIDSDFCLSLCEVCL